MKSVRDPHGDARELESERLEFALRASNEGIWDWWVGEQAIYYSRRILEFLECGDHQAPNIFLAPHDAIAPDDVPALERALREALQVGRDELFAVDARVRTGGGLWRWLRIRGTVIRDRTGNAIRIAGSMIDISRRKNAEAQVEEERHILRQLIDHVPLQIYFKDLESHFVLVNVRKAKRMGCTDSSEMVGKHDRDFFSSEHSEGADRDEKNIIATGEAMPELLEEETWGEGRKNTWVLSAKFPWKDRSGTIRGTFGVSNDVTKLVRAEQAATELAIELQQRNAAYEKELHLAREIQQALSTTDFPPIRSDDGTRVAFRARYIPISGLAGDFYEVIPISENVVGILICDVMGHGVRSALIVAMLRGLLEKQRAQAQDPGQFLRGLNVGLAAILQRAGATMFATAFYGVIDLRENTLKYACAGHPGPIIATTTGVHQLATGRKEKGPGLGIISGSVYPTHELSLQDVQRLILFTDGVLEPENQQGEPFFEQRLMELIRNRSDVPLDPLLDDILGSVLEFSNTRQFDDDVCLLGIELQRQPGHP
ncbi:MAG: SpoIIE family protein phosphatase [Verrucomicrobiota bacterium]